MKTTKTTALSAAFALALTLGLGACSDEGAETTTPPAAEDTNDNGGDAGDGGDSGDDGTDGTDETGDDGTGGDTGAGDTGAGDADPDDVTNQALDAISAAEQETGGIAYEIDDRNGSGTWEVDVAVDDRSVEVSIDADGAVVGTEDDDLDGDDRAGLEAATITLSDAIKLAIDEVGGYLDDAELEAEGGEHYWEVSLDGTDQGDDIEVKVSVTGEIVEIDD